MNFRTVLVVEATRIVARNEQVCRVIVNNIPFLMEDTPKMLKKLRRDNSFWIIWINGCFG
jgi:hypothetical protein